VISFLVKLSIVLALVGCAVPEQPVPIRSDVRVVLKVAELPENIPGSAL
jgi:hypothetical protein